jgi:hypothetical protein
MNLKDKSLVKKIFTPNKVHETIRMRKTPSHDRLTGRWVHTIKEFTFEVPLL